MVLSRKQCRKCSDILQLPGELFYNAKISLRKLPGGNLDLTAVQSLISLLSAQHEEGLFLAPAGLAVLSALALF